MSPKSGYRFSEQITLRRKGRGRRPASFTGSLPG